MDETSDKEARYRRNWQKFLDLMHFANEAGRRQCLRRNPEATEEEVRAFLREWWGRLKKDEELPPGWTVHTEWRHRG